MVAWVRTSLCSGRRLALVDYDVTMYMGKFHVLLYTIPILGREHWDALHCLILVRAFKH